MELYIAPVNDLWANAPPLLAADFVVALTYATIILCAYKIKRFVRSATIARESLKVQNQVHLALIAQAIVPLILIVIPLGGAIALLLLGVEQLHFFVLSCTGFVAWIPVVNPLCAMYFIKPYRREIKRRFASTVYKSRSVIQPSNGTSVIQPSNSSD
ncbi:7TM GPCR protein [Aphelenchoides avenae]|nr:7TM GPCR protein [Aphelenchus avenae]